MISKWWHVLICIVVHSAPPGLVVKKVGSSSNPRTTVLMDNLEDDTFKNWVQKVGIDVKVYNVWMAKCETAESSNYYADLEFKQNRRNDCVKAVTGIRKDTGVGTQRPALLPGLMPTPELNTPQDESNVARDRCLGVVSHERKSTPKGRAHRALIFWCSFRQRLASYRPHSQPMFGSLFVWGGGAILGWRLYKNSA